MLARRWLTSRVKLVKSAHGVINLDLAALQRLEQAEPLGLARLVGCRSLRGKMRPIFGRRSEWNDRGRCHVCF